MTKKISLSNKSEYDAALAKARSLMDAAPGSREEEALEALVFSIGEYEQTHHPIGPPDTIGAVKFRMEQASPQGKAKLIAQAGKAMLIGGGVLFPAAFGKPYGNIRVKADGISLYFDKVSSLLALRIAKLVRQEREGTPALGETTLEIGSSKDTPDGHFHADDEIYLDGSIGIGIPVTPQADLHVVGRVQRMWGGAGGIFDEDGNALLAASLLGRLEGKWVEVTVRVLLDGAHGDSIIVDESVDVLGGGGLGPRHSPVKEE